MNRCLNCRKPFNPKAGNQQFCCYTCRYEYQKKHKPPKIQRKSKKKSLDEKVKEAEEYNRIHGTRYSHGRYMADKEAGKLRKGFKFAKNASQNKWLLDDNKTAIKVHIYEKETVRSSGTD